MILRPGDLLGLPAGFPDVVYEAAALRYLLLALALLWAALAARARPTLVLAGGILFVEVALGFWILAQNRPYGLAEDPAATQRAAQIAVDEALSGSNGSFISGEAARPSAWRWLVRRGVPAGALQLLPTLLPLLILPATGVAVALLWERRDLALLAACLWLAASTGDLDALAGVGFVPGIWLHPQSAVALVLLLAAVLAVGRLRLPDRVATSLGLVLIGAWLLVPAPEPSRSLASTLFLLTLDQGAWLVLGGLGLARGADVTARSLVLGGGALVVMSGLGFRVEPWGSHAVYRLGLILAAAGPLSDLGRRLVVWLSGRIPSLAPLDSRRPGTALLLLLIAPGSFLAWWDPPRLDPVANASLVLVSPSLLMPAAWIQRQTPPPAVFLASADYAPLVAALGGRRVLRAPSLTITLDDPRRVRAEGAILAGRALGPALRAYAVDYVFVAPGDFRARGLKGPEDLEGRPGFRLVYADEHRFRVYQISRVE